MNFKSFPGANPYLCSMAEFFVLGDAILMRIGSHRIYVADVGPDPVNHF